MCSLRSARFRASPTSVLADEKVMPEKEPILALAEEKEIIGLMSSPAEEEPYITSTKDPFAILGELMDAEAATEATGSLDKMSGWPEGGIASAGKASNDFPRLALALTLPLEVDQRR